MSGDVLWLSDIPPGSRSLVGGKALALGALIGLGIPVPPAFVVTTHAYTPNRVIPPTLQTQIATALETLRDHTPAGSRLIVRSSAPFEDSVDFSAAGQLESCVCAFTLDGVLDAIRRCWAALSRPAFRDYYRFAGGSDAPRLAVIVQALIETDTGGVLFTQMGDLRETLLIEATWGMCHAVTAGIVTPERYVIDRRTHQVVELSPIMRQPVRATLGGQGKLHLLDAPHLAGKRPLAADQVGRLVDVGMRLEAHFGVPQDIEWGFRDGILTIFQARPVTVAASGTVDDVYHISGPDDARIWVSGFFEERFPDAVLPLTWSYLFPIIEQTALREPLHYIGVPHVDDREILRVFNGRVYTDLTVIQMLYKFFPGFLLPDDARRFFPNGNTALRRHADQPHFLRLVWGVLCTCATERNWHPWNYRVWRRFGRSYETALAQHRRRLGAHDAQPDPAALLAILEDLRNLTGKLLRIHRWSLNYAEVFNTVLRKFVTHWTTISPERVQTYLVHTESPTMRTDRRLWAIARRAMALGLSGEDVRQAATQQTGLIAMMDDFLGEFGHRSFGLDLMFPRYADDPAQVWTIVAGLMQPAANFDPDEQARQWHGEYVRLYEELDDQLRQTWLARVLPWKAWIVRLVLFFARRYGGLREEQRFAWQKALHLMRQAFMLAETRLISRRLLHQPGDVFFLRWDEFKTLLMGGEGEEVLSPGELAKRRRQFKRIRHALYPRFVQGNQPYAAAASQFAGILYGVGASAGQAVGTARVIMSPGSLGELLDRLGPEDILVTRATDPGWTPVFGWIRALVMSVGGQLSHGAIVAREYGLPAVVGVGEQANSIRDGDRLLVDGDSGTIVILER